MEVVGEVRKRDYRIDVEKEDKKNQFEDIRIPQICRKPGLIM